VLFAKGRNIRIGQPVYLQNTFSEMRLQEWIGPLPVPTIEDSSHRGIGKKKTP